MQVSFLPGPIGPPPSRTGIPFCDQSGPSQKEAMSHNLQDKTDKLTEAGESYLSVNDLKRIRSKSAIPAMAFKDPIVVRGTAGIGKSAFALFLLYILIRRYPNCSFIYRHGVADSTCYIHYQGETFTRSSVQAVFHDALFVRYLTANYRNHIWIILDGESAPPVGLSFAKMIILTTCHKKTFRKPPLENAVQIVLPLWSLDDIQVLRKAAFPKLSAASVSEAYYRFGGIPGTVLNGEYDESRTKTLADSLSLTKLLSSFDYVTPEIIDHSGVWDLYFHLIPGEGVPPGLENPVGVNFRYADYWWASTWLQTRIWSQFIQHNGDKSALTFLLDWKTPNASTFGFEPHAFRTIEKHGIVGRRKELSLKGPKELVSGSLEPLGRRTFSQISEISNGKQDQAGHFYVPMQTDLSSVDFCLPQYGILGQVTAGQKQGVRLEYLDAAVNSGIFDEWQTEHPGEKLTLVFLCPTNLYNSFIRQPYLTSQRTAITDPATVVDIDKRFNQIAWELDIEDQLRKTIEMEKKEKKESQRIISSLAGKASARGQLIPSRDADPPNVRALRSGTVYSTETRRGTKRSFSRISNST